MKIGDRVRVTFEDGTQKEGRLIYITLRGYKIDFLDGEPPVFVSNELSIEVIEVSPADTHPAPGPRPDKKQPWGLYLALLLFAAVVVLAFIFIK